MKYFHLFFCRQEVNIFSANLYLIKKWKIRMGQFHLFFTRKGINISNTTIQVVKG